jgi:hypothetical protein
VPAAVRRRWGTRVVLAEDQGDQLVLRPAPDDPIEGVRGIFAEEMQSGLSIGELRAAARAEEAEIEQAKASRR